MLSNAAIGSSHLTTTPESSCWKSVAFTKSSKYGKWISIKLLYILQCKCYRYLSIWFALQFVLMHRYFCAVFVYINLCAAFVIQRNIKRKRWTGKLTICRKIFRSYLHKVHTCVKLWHSILQCCEAYGEVWCLKLHRFTCLNWIYVFWKHRQLRPKICVNLFTIGYTYTQRCLVIWCF